MLAKVQYEGNVKLPIGLQCKELRGSEVPSLWHRTSDYGESKS